MEEGIKPVEITISPEAPVQSAKKSNLPKIVIPACIAMRSIAGRLLIVILLIAVGVYAGMQIGKKQATGGLVNKITPTPIPQLTKVIDETADWKTYKNEKYGFEVKYDSQLTVNELGETDVTYGYLQTIVFGTGLNSLKSRYGFGVTIISSSTLEDARAKIVGHVTDKIDSEEDLIVNNNKWRKINYKIFLTTDYVPITTAVIDYGGYSYWLVASMQDIDQILSTFKFLPAEISNKEIKNWKTLKLKKLEFKIPSSWWFEEGKNETSPTQWFDLNPTDLGSPRKNGPAYILRVDTKENSLPEEKQELIKSWRLKINKEDIITVNQVKGIVMEGLCIPPEGVTSPEHYCESLKINSQSKFAFFVKGKDVYLLMGNTSLDNGKVFDQILSTFKFTN